MSIREKISKIFPAYRATYKSKTGTPKVKPLTNKKFVPYYGKAGGTMSNGAGWGGERSSIKNKKDPMDMLRRGMQGKKR